MTKFCILPFIQTTLSNNGKYKLCCDSTEIPVSGSISEVFSSDYYKNIREHFITSDELPPECSKCKFTESIGSNSLRTRKLNNKKYSSYINDIESIDTQFPKELDIKLGNRCNLRCVMCSAYFSSSIEEYVRNNNKFNNFPEFTQTEKTKLDVENTLLNILDNINNIDSLKFTGGEPFIHQNFFSFLNKLSHIKPNVDLQIITNGTLLNDKIFSVLSRFHKLKLSVSVDSIGKHYDEIRRPFKWENMETILYKLFKTNLNYELNITISTFNYKNSLFLIHWLIKNEQYNWNLNFVKQPEYLDISILPNTDKTMMRSNIRFFFTRYKECLTREQQNFINDYIKHLSQPENPILMNRYREFVGVINEN